MKTKGLLQYVIGYFKESLKKSTAWEVEEPIGEEGLEVFRQRHIDWHSLAAHSRNFIVCDLVKVENAVRGDAIQIAVSASFYVEPKARQLGTVDRKMRERLLPKLGDEVGIVIDKERVHVLAHVREPLVAANPHILFEIVHDVRTALVNGLYVDPFQETEEMQEAVSRLENR